MAQTPARAILGGMGDKPNLAALAAAFVAFAATTAWLGLSEPAAFFFFRLWPTLSAMTFLSDLADGAARRRRDPTTPPADLGARALRALLIGALLAAVSLILFGVAATAS